eukprot:CAMPEP_0176458702 /NCGR_PEP_ID=MMETSP0127-20121128/32778_1 /TAXON_ID=938130 /ORGANISM="Platyophrya macrostoma, Strain WH" /LENGTH=275 /DNA_ID=CAMNT_0017849377 /DNA_START=25 /DNA_END=852 /DNA_ORIENTATION=-
MSLLVGKRTYLDSFGESPMSVHGGYQASGKLYKSNTFSTNTRPDPAKILLQKNLDLLKSLYQGVEEKELISALEDCDNNLELAKQVVNAIKKDRYLNFEELKRTEPFDSSRDIRKMTIKHKSDITPVVKPQQPKTDMMDESVEKKSGAAAPQKNNQESKYKDLTLYLINGMKNSPDLGTAEEFLFTTLKNVFDAEEKKHEAVLKKEQEDKSVMIRVFLKLRDKNKDLTEKNAEYTQKIESTEKELQDLKSINYKLGLMLRSLDSQQINGFSNEVY